LLLAASGCGLLAAAEESFVISALQFVKDLKCYKSLQVLQMLQSSLLCQLLLLLWQLHLQLAPQLQLLMQQTIHRMYEHRIVDYLRA